MNKLIILAGILQVSLATAGESALERNKRIVHEFYAMAFNDHKPREAAMKYLAPSYIQHNPGVADGRKGFIEAFSQAKKTDDSHSEFKRTIAEGDLVVLHSHVHERPGDLGFAVVDIFRVTNGTITEHWDVGKPVPATAKNNNTMF